MGSDGAREYFEKLKLIEQFCGGDTEMAKKILKGEFKDIIAIKGRFKSGDDEFFGLFVVFLSRITQSVIANYSIISQSASLYLYKPFEYWKVFVDKIDKELNDNVSEMGKSELLNGLLERLNELNFYDNIFTWVESNDIKSLTEKFGTIVRKVIKNQNIEVLLDFESITSLILYEEIGIRPKK